MNLNSVLGSSIGRGLIGGLSLEVQKASVEAQRAYEEYERNRPKTPEERARIDAEEEFRGWME